MTISNPHVALLEQARSSWLYPIYIPSYRRAGTAPLLEMLKSAYPSVQRKVHIVVRTFELNAYRDEYPWATVVREGQNGIGPARMRCLIDAERRGYDRIVILDDDIHHVSLLERIEREGKGDHTRRFSAGVSGIPEPHLLVRSLSVACDMADGVFSVLSGVAYGAARNALFSGDVDTSIGATVNKGSFPACVMFIDVNRFKMRAMPEPYRFHGEDLAMCLDTMIEGQDFFTLPSVAYDQNANVVTTIPLDPMDAVARTPDWENAAFEYPGMHPYLKASVKNKLGGVMRIGINWPQWYRDTGTEPVEIPLSQLLES